MRFCKQRDRYSCGAVALLNIDKFFGSRATYQDLPKYRKLVNCDQHGTQDWDITRVLGRTSRCKWPKAKRFLQEKNCILIKWWGHLFLMVMNNYDIQIVNQGSKTTELVSSSDASWLLCRPNLVCE